ncbi:hypothetical protein GW17_00035624 [Ensete ventricosum]|nr:hypothetical protein GW17_00035624 [Ensete ventricosum]
MVVLVGGSPRLRLPLTGWLPLQGGFGRGRPPPYRGPWPEPAAPCNWPGRGWPPLFLAVLTANAEIVSAAKLLQSDLATLAQREGGE